MGRESTFADARTIKLINQNFVAVAADDWYQRRREDDEGVFFRKVSDQGPRKNNTGATRQGIYALTASGKLLGYRNHPDADVMHRFMQEALKAWQQLPASERSAEVGEATKVDANYARTPPKGGLIVNVFTRILDRADDFFCHGTCKFPGGQRAAHDRLWLTAEEVQSLLPHEAKEGQEIALSSAITYRLARFHLVDNTRGEPPMWSKAQVRTFQTKLVVESASGAEVSLKLTGAFLLATDINAKTAQRGFEGDLLGTIRFDAKSRQVTRFDVVAVGDHWGVGPFTGGARPGRSPLGVAFELGSPERAADRVPPQAARESGAYYRAER